MTKFTHPRHPFLVLVDELLALSDIEFAACRPDLLAPCLVRLRTEPGAAVPADPPTLASSPR